MAFFAFFEILLKNWNFYKMCTKNRINIPNTPFESLCSILLGYEIFKNFWCLFVTKTVIFWKMDFVEKSQKITFVGKNRFSTDWPGSARMMIYGRKCVLWTSKNILQWYFHDYLILKHIWKKSKKIDFWLWIFRVVGMKKLKNTVLVTKRHKKCCDHDFTHMNSLPHQYRSLSRTYLSPIIIFVSRPLEAENQHFY